MRLQRPLCEMVSEVLEAVLDLGARTAGVRAKSVELSLPIEASFEPAADGAWTLLADVPAWRWRTEFDVLPGRLRVTVEEHER
jgi:hypothetical protein